jgi:hypothetical protein
LIVGLSVSATALSLLAAVTREWFDRHTRSD